MQTRFDPALQYTDARFGPEAALAAFDAQFTTELLAVNNDRVINNQFAGGGIQLFQQDLVTLRSELSKTTAAGTRFALRGVTEYDDNNAPANAFANIYDLSYEAEARQPLLRGSGVTFNRIAGPDAVPGFYNGVVIARVNNEISEAEFETGLRDFLSDVTNAYWELYFAYRNLEATKQARDRALVVADQLKARAESGLKDAAERELLAREQYYRFQGEVEEALAGRPIEFTFTGGGRGGGTFRGGGGVQTADRRLRLLMGVPVNQPRPVRPVLANEAAPADVRFDWSAISARALGARPELRRQRLRVRRAEMELVAAKNFLSPRLDAVARYRLRGFGDDLLDPDGGPAGLGPDNPAVLQPGSDAYDILSSGDFQEWELGVEFSMPIGFRRAHAAVQNAELQTSRERALLREQERQVVYDLSNAVAEKDRAYQALQTAMNRYASASQLLGELEVKFGVEKPRDVNAPDDADAAAEALADGNSAVGEVNLDRLLDAQRRVTDSELAVFRARAAFEVAVKNVFFETGELFQYHEVFLTGGGAGAMGDITGGPGFTPPPAPRPADGSSPEVAPAPVPLPADDGDAAGDGDAADGPADEPAARTDDAAGPPDAAPAFGPARPGGGPAAPPAERSPGDRREPEPAPPVAPDPFPPASPPEEEAPAAVPLGDLLGPGLPAPGRVSLDF